MEGYLAVTRKTSKLFTKSYSTSFSLASRRFDSKIRPHIYATYGLTRIADEIVDTYRGKDAAQLLNELESETIAALQRKYSVNPIVHSFQATANKHGINEELITPFFASMRSDITKKHFNIEEYKSYIHGSAEVVGLMCLRVFCDGDEALYGQLKTGAAHLGAAYQKVNFLRDVAADHQQLGRYYFPDGDFDSLDEQAKTVIINDIKQDFKAAWPNLQQLPLSARKAVMTSYRYYAALLRKLERTPIETIKTKRVRINNFYKLILFAVPVNSVVR